MPAEEFGVDPDVLREVYEEQDRGFASPILICLT
jgi:hypothetical protein